MSVGSENSRITPRTKKTTDRSCRGEKVYVEARVDFSKPASEVKGRLASTQMLTEEIKR